MLSGCWAGRFDFLAGPWRPMSKCRYSRSSAILYSAQVGAAPVVQIFPGSTVWESYHLERWPKSFPLLEDVVVNVEIGNSASFKKSVSAVLNICRSAEVKSVQRVQYPKRPANLVKRNAALASRSISPTRTHSHHEDISALR